MKQKEQCGMRRFLFAVFTVLLMSVTVFGLAGSTSYAAAKKAKSVKLNYSAYTLKKGKKVKLKATVSPKGASKKIVWKSSKKAVVSVSQKGVVTGRKKGTAKITATVKGTKIKATCKITVGTPVKKITVAADSMQLKLGESRKIESEITPAKASNKKLSYESSNEAVATVSKSGVVTAVAPGTAKITLMTKDGSKKKAVVVVTVLQEETTPPQTETPSQTEVPAQTETPIQTETPSQAETPAQTERPVQTEALIQTEVPAQTESETTGGISVTVTPASATLHVGDTVDLEATVDSQDTPDQTVTWSSSNTRVVEIDANGKVTAKRVGYAVVTAATADGSNTASANITVEATVKIPYDAWYYDEEDDYECEFGIESVDVNGETQIRIRGSAWSYDVPDWSCVYFDTVGDAKCSVEEIDGERILRIQTEAGEVGEYPIFFEKWIRPRDLSITDEGNVIAGYTDTYEWDEDEKKTYEVLWICGKNASFAKPAFTIPELKEANCTYTPVENSPKGIGVLHIRYKTQHLQWWVRYVQEFMEFEPSRIQVSDNTLVSEYPTRQTYELWGNPGAHLVYHLEGKEATLGTVTAVEFTGIDSSEAAQLQWTVERKNDDGWNYVLSVTGNGTTHNFYIYYKQKRTSWGGEYTDTDGKKYNLRFESVDVNNKQQVRLTGSMEDIMDWSRVTVFGGDSVITEKDGVKVLQVQIAEGIEFDYPVFYEKDISGIDVSVSDEGNELTCSRNLYGSGNGYFEICGSSDSLKNPVFTSPVKGVSFSYDSEHNSLYVGYKTQSMRYDIRYSKSVLSDPQTGIAELSLDLSSAMPDGELPETVDESTISEPETSSAKNTESYQSENTETEAQEDLSLYPCEEIGDEIIENMDVQPTEELVDNSDIPEMVEGCPEDITTNLLEDMILGFPQFYPQ